MDLTRPFLGSTALARGLVTPKQLRGPRFRSPVHGVFVETGAPDTFLLHCEAVALAVGALDDVVTGARSDLGTALAGWAAAQMLGAECAPEAVPVDLLVTTGHRRSLPGIRAHHQLALPGEIVTGVPIPVPGPRTSYVPGRTVTTTSALRTAFDLARTVERIDAVIALDALSRVGGFAPTDVLDLAPRHPGARGLRRLPTLVALANPLAESPMETRVRLALHDHGVPPPVLQHPIGDYRIDLAYPDLRLGIEYDGGHHLDPRRARDDLIRQAFLTAHGWQILRPDAWQVHRRPDLVAATVWAHLTGRSPR